MSPPKIVAQRTRLIVLGAILVAMLGALVASMTTRDRESHTVLMRLVPVLGLVFAIVYRSTATRAARQQLLELGWTLVVVLLAAFLACALIVGFSAFLVSPWGYVLFGVAVGMVVVGHLLPKRAESEA